MDWDEAKKSSSSLDAVTVGETLERHSVAELEHRIGILEAEIERVRAELAKKRDHEAQAASIFKS